MNPPENYSWPQYRLYVVTELKRVAEVLEAVDARLDHIERKHDEEAGRKKAMKAIAAAFGAFGAAAVELFARIFLHNK